VEAWWNASKPSMLVVPCNGRRKAEQKACRFHPKWPHCRRASIFGSPQMAPVRLLIPGAQCAWNTFVNCISQRLAAEGRRGRADSVHPPGLRHRCIIYRSPKLPCVACRPLFATLPCQDLVHEFPDGPQRVVFRNPILQGHIAEHSGLQCLVVATHIQKTRRTINRYPVSGPFSGSS